MQKPEIITIDSGRKIAAYQLAKGNGQRTVVFCHAAPGAGNLDPVPEETAKRQITLISVDRPGYGHSEPITGDRWSSVDVAADDLAEVLQQMNITSPIGVVGWSAGGRVALALAARRPALVDRVVIVATPAPEEAVPWIPDAQKQGLEALRPLPPAEVHSQLSGQFEQMLSQNQSKEGRLSLLGRSPADEEALAMPGVADRLDSMLEAAFAQGSLGLAADVAGYGLRPWGFEPAEVQAKALCLYGSKDPIAGSRHGTWWQKNLANARLEMVPDAGHLVIFPMWQRVLSFLAPRNSG
jgi:pimeloyl-ACP methyl ester carboxylesterase